MGKLLSWAYKNSLDVLFIQEHNGDRAKVSEWKALCKRSGYSYMCHAQTNTLLIFVAIACNFHEAPLLPFILYRSTPKFLPLYLT